jgi:hypothetical protein
MLDYNLTQRERQIIIRLIELSQHTKEHFEARIVDSCRRHGSIPLSWRGSFSALTVIPWTSPSATCAC